MIFCTESPRNLWALRFCKLVENETSINLFILLRNLDHAQKSFIKVDKKSSCYFLHQSLCVPKPPATTTLQHMLYHSRRNRVKPPVTFGQWVVMLIVIIVWLICLFFVVVFVFVFVFVRPLRTRWVTARRASVSW